MNKPKNVIWITTDHMRYDCIGANGNNTIHPPNLGRLVKDGASFSDCYGQNPLCMLTLTELWELWEYNNKFENSRMRKCENSQVND